MYGDVQITAEAVSGARGQSWVSDMVVGLSPSPATVPHQGCSSLPLTRWGWTKSPSALLCHGRGPCQFLAALCRPR